MIDEEKDERNVDHEVAVEHETRSKFYFLMNFSSSVASGEEKNLKMSSQEREDQSSQSLVDAHPLR